ncbi:efflux RND transporter permease subunit [Amphritea sp. HPY]|uniref:efflux RND transporter permease subunit n=1 Tax=Amphritea sp. HPY TaxID=3421652 RepID=UPI003D7EEE0E
MKVDLLRFFSKLFRYPQLVLALLFLFLLLLIINIPRLTLDTSADSLVLEGDKALQQYREVSKRYQFENNLVIAYAPDEELYSERVLQRIASLRDDLETLPQVSSVTSILDVPLLYSPPVKLSSITRGVHYLNQPELDRALARQEFRDSPLYKNLLTSPTADTTALLVNLKRDEYFFELLRARDDLRSKQLRHMLTQQERKALKKAEGLFRAYSVTANERERELVLSVRKKLDQHRDHATIFLGGVPMIAADMIAFIESDLVIFATSIILFIIIMMAVIFRRVRWVVLPLITCLATTVGMLGYIAWVEWQLTVISSNFTALLLIITLAISIHLVVRYREYHHETPETSQRNLVLNTLAFMAKPCFFTAITTIVAFASLVFSGIRPVIDFGWMMSIGVAIALLMAFTLLPASLLLISKGDSKIRNKTRPLTHYFACITDRYGKTILVVSGLLLIFSILGISQLKVENRFIDYFHESTEIYQGMLVIDRKLGGTIPLEIILTAPEAALSDSSQEYDSQQLSDNEAADDPFSDSEFDDVEFDDSQFEEMAADPFTDAPSQSPDTRKTDNQQTSYWFSRAGLDELEQVHRFLEGLDETGKVLSLTSLYQVLKDVAGRDIDDFQLALVRKNLPEDVKNLLITPYLSQQGNEVRISARVMETSYNLKRQELLRRIETFLTNDMGYQPEQIKLTGMLVLYNNMLQSLFSSQITTLGVVFLAITLMFTLLFRSLYLALIAITPNLLAAAVVLGGMGLCGIPLDMMTITIAAITIGIGVDDTIHYIHRFREEFPKDRNYRATMYRCHNSIGKAMFYTSVIIIAGFSILTLSNFTPTVYFGLLIGLAMFSALMGALLLLPQLIITLKPLGR